MPSSSDSSASSLEFIGATSPHAARALATDVGVAATALSGPVSTLRIQRAVDALCRNHGVPTGYTATLAGDRRACTPPPEGAVCVYAHALEAGMRLPLPCFFSEVLTHYGLAPSQLSPNAWRVLLGFVVLCHDTGVPPSLAVFRHFFSLGKSNLRGWYIFRGKDGVGSLFTRLPKLNKRWKEGFFFLRSPEPWPCPVRWGEPPSLTDQALTCQQKKSVAKLLGAQGIPVNLLTYLCETNIAAAFASNLAEQGNDQSGMQKVKTEPGGNKTALSGKKRNRDETNSNDGFSQSELSSLLAQHRRQDKPLEKLLGTHIPSVDLSTHLSETNLAAATPPQTQRSICSRGGKGMDLEAEPNGSTLWPLSGKKRKHNEANSKVGVSRSELSTTRAELSCSATNLCTPPGFDPIPRHLPIPDAQRTELEHKLPAAKPSGPSTNGSMLQMVNYVSAIALELEKKLAAKDAELKKMQDDHAATRAELEKKLVAQDAEVAAMRGQLKQGKAVHAECEFAAALQQLLVSEELVWRRAERALEGYRRLKRKLSMR